MNPASAVQGVAGRARDLSPDAECRGERRHRVEAPVEPKHKLIEIGRKVLCAHTVVRTELPRRRRSCGERRALRPAS